MKTIIKSSLAISLIVALALICTACGGGKTPAVSDIVAAITKDYPLSEAMNEIKSDKISNKIGLESTDYTDIAAYVNQSGVEQDEIIIVKAANADSKAKIKEVLNTNLTTKMNSTKNYNPEQYKIVSNCNVSENEDYIWLIISPNADAMNKIVEEQLK